MLNVARPGRTADSARPTRPTLIAILSVLLLATTLAFSLSVLLRAPGEELPWADTWAYNLSFLLAAAIAGLRGWRDRTQRGWLAMALGLFLYALGGFAYALAPVFGYSQDAPSVPDIFWFALLPLAFIAMLSLARERMRIAVRYAWLDALTVGAGSFAVAVRLIDARIGDETVVPQLTTTINGLYLLGDLVLLVMALVVIQIFMWRPPVAWWLLFAGIASFAISDGFYVVQTAIGTYAEGGALDLGWPLSALFIGLAAAFDRGTRRFDRRDGSSSLIAPTIAVAASAVVLLSSPNPGIRWVPSIAAFLTVGLGLARMILGVRDADRFAQRLRTAEADSLTGLLNRRGLAALPPRAIADRAILFFDLDGFSDVNESFGHAAGDLVLVETARRLVSGVRVTDTVARVDGDEFIVLLQRVDSAEAIEIAESLIRRIEEPITVHNVQVPISACAGIARVAPGSASLDEPIREAGLALTRAKAAGIGLVQTFEGEAGDRSAERLRLRADIREAIAAGGDSFIPYYQPIVSLATGEVFASEALIRWAHGGRILNPGTFLREAHLAGAMRQLTEMMMHRALREMRAHQVVGAVTVNVTPDLLDVRLAPMIESALAASGSDPSQLIIEVTEDALVRDPDGARAVLDDVRSRGVRVLLDDFGTGWAGFSTLRDLAADGLKIDASFVAGMNTDPTAMSIIRAIELVAGDLGAVTIYEGAEGEETIERLRTFDGGYCQGFGIARPMPIEDLARWTHSRHPAGETH